MADPVVLLLPGWQNAGPDHWQRRWARCHGYRRVAQHDGMRPLRGDWIAQLQDTVLDMESGRAPDAPARVVLAADSLGCHLVAAWAAHSQLGHRIRGALLVAPCDPQRDELAGLLGSWSQMALQPLHWPAVLLASQQDPHCSTARARQFADAWGAQFVDGGDARHRHRDRGLGVWPEAHARLLALCQGDASVMSIPTVSQASGVKHS